MRVLLIHNFYQQFGGEDAVVQAEKAMLESHGVEVRLYSRHNDEIKEFGLGQKLAFPLHTISSAQTAADLPKVIAEFEPDFAYLHNLYPLISPVVYETLHDAAVPIVQVIHDFRPFCSNGWFYANGEVCERCLGGNHWHAVAQGCYRGSRVFSGIYAATLQHARSRGWLDLVDGFVCLTPFAKQKLVEAGIAAERVLVRPNCIDTRSIAPDFTGEYALFMGRLSAEKGVRTLVEAFRQAREVPLVIVGTGPLEAELRERAADAPNIRFTGFLSGEEKRDVVRNARFSLMCSEWYENFPVVILEAFAAGKPVLGSRLGSVPYLIDEGQTGELFTAGDAADLARQARSLWQQPELTNRLGRNARRVVESRYDSAKSFDQLMDIFAAVTGAATAEAAVGAEL